MFDYRALGDPVSTASRLEGANKYLGTNLCLSAAALPDSGKDSSHEAPICDIRPIGRLLLKGKTQSLQVYEPVAAFRAAGYAPLADYCAAYALMADSATDEATDNDHGAATNMTPYPASTTAALTHEPQETHASHEASHDSPALQAFRQLAERFPDDPLVALHFNRLKNGARGALIVLDAK